MSTLSKFIVLLGPPGSGKGTQASLLAERLAVPTISTGDMVRAAMSSGSELGLEVAEVVNSGELVSDDTMARLVEARLTEPDAADGALLDGYPRTLGQAATLDSILEGKGERLTAVLMIDADESELVRRMLGRGRADDSDEVIRRRLAVYREQTEPLVEHYRRRGLLLEVDGNLPIDEVRDAILESLGMATDAVEVER